MMGIYYMKKIIPPSRFKLRTCFKRMGFQLKGFKWMLSIFVWFMIDLKSFTSSKITKSLIIPLWSLTLLTVNYVTELLDFYDMAEFLFLKYDDVAISTSPIENFFIVKGLKVSRLDGFFLTIIWPHFTVLFKCIFFINWIF